MQPTIGRIVDFRQEDGSTLPAIVTAVGPSSSESIVLTVFTLAGPQIQVAAEGTSPGQWSWPNRASGGAA